MQVSGKIHSCNYSPGFPGKADRELPGVKWLFLSFPATLRYMATGRRADDWDRLADFVKTRRGTLGMTQDELATRAGVDKKTIYAIESAPGRRRMTTLGGLERALGWAEGSIRHVLNGGEPTLQDEFAVQVRDQGWRRTVIAKVTQLPDDDAALEIIDRQLDMRLEQLRRSAEHANGG